MATLKRKWNRPQRRRGNALSLYCPSHRRTWSVICPRWRTDPARAEQTGTDSSRRLDRQVLSNPGTEGSFLLFEIIKEKSTLWNRGSYTVGLYWSEQIVESIDRENSCKWMFFYRSSTLTIGLRTRLIVTGLNNVPRIKRRRARRRVLRTRRQICIYIQ